FDVAGTPGKGVVAPGAADVAGALEDDEILDAFALEADGGAKAAEPAADDGDGGGRHSGHNFSWSRGWRPLPEPSSPARRAGSSTIPCVRQSASRTRRRRGFSASVVRSCPADVSGTTCAASPRAVHS